MKKLLLSCLILFMGVKFAGAQYAIGDEAMDFSFKNVDGELVSMADYESAKGFIVVFTCNTCPWAQKYEDRINTLNKKYESKGFPVIALNPNDPELKSGDSYSAMIDRANDHKYSFPYLTGEKVVSRMQHVAKTYGATRTPHTFVLEKKEDKLFVRYIGAIDDDPQGGSEDAVKYVEAAVDAIMEGKEITTTSTKAIGCGIKWAVQ